MQEILKSVSGYSEGFITIIAFLAVVVSILGAFKSGALSHLKFGAFEIKAGADERKAVREIIESAVVTPKERVPFETEQLANYYSQVLAQSKVSFWFSLVFASIGFFIIRCGTTTTAAERRLTLRSSGRPTAWHRRPPLSSNVVRHEEGRRGNANDIGTIGVEAVFLRQRRQ